MHTMREEGRREILCWDGRVVQHSAVGCERGRGRVGYAEDEVRCLFPRACLYEYKQLCIVCEFRVEDCGSCGEGEGAGGVGEDVFWDGGDGGGVGEAVDVEG